MKESKGKKIPRDVSNNNIQNSCKYSSIWGYFLPQAVLIILLAIYIIQIVTLTKHCVQFTVKSISFHILFGGYTCLL